MYKEIIDYDIFQWMVSLKVLSSASHVKQLGVNKYELDETLSRQFINGKKIGELLKELLSITNQHVVKLVNYKDTLNKEDRLQNWNFNEKYLRMFGMTLSQEYKTQFIRGDHQKVNNFLRDILNFSLEKLEQIIQEKKANQHQEIQENEAFKQDLINREQNPQSLFDFITFSLKKELNLQNHDQVIALLAEKNKYFTKIIILGMRQEYAQIISWISYINNEMHKIFELLNYDHSNFVQFVELIKPTFLSKEQKIAEQGLAIYQKLVTSSFKELFIAWFLDNEVFQIMMNCYQKNLHLQDKITKFFPYVGEKVIFTLDKKDLYDYINTLSMILPDFSINNQTYLKLWESNFIFSLLGDCQNLLDRSLQHKCKSIQFIGLIKVIWQHYYTKFNQQHQTQISNLLKKCVRSKSHMLQTYALNCFFELLEYFAHEKSQNAPYIYKTLVFFLIELHEDVRIREYLLLNFSESFQKLHQMPVSLLLNPLLRQIKEGLNKSYILNTFDLEFFKNIIAHPQINVQIIIAIYEYFFTIFITDVRWAQSILELFVLIESFFYDDEIFIQKMSKLSHDILQLLFKQEKNLIKMQQVEKKQVDTQKRNHLILFMKQISQQNIELNIMPRIIRYYNHLYQLRKNPDNIFYKILGFFGDPEALIQSHKKNMDLESNQNINNSFQNEIFQGNYYGEHQDHQDPGRLRNSQIQQHSGQKPEIFSDNSFQSARQQTISNEKYTPRYKSQKRQEIQSFSQYKQKNFQQLNLSYIKKMEYQYKQKKLQQQYTQINEDLSSQKSMRKTVKIKVQPIEPLSFGCLDLNLIEDEEREHLNLVLRKFDPFFRFLFQRYSSAMAHPQSLNNFSFEQLEQNYDKVSPLEIQKMLHEMDWMRHIKKDVYNKMIQHINLMIGRKTIIHYNLQQYTEVIQMLSQYFLSNKPFEYGHWPIGQKLEIFLFTIYRFLRGVEPSVLKHQALFKTKEYTFVKENTKQIYNLQSQEKIPDSLVAQLDKPIYSEMYELVGDILKEKLNINLKESYYNIDLQEAPISPKVEKSVSSVRQITTNSTQLAAPLKEQTKKFVGQKGHRSFNNDKENMNKFALSRLKIITEKQQEEEEKVKSFLYQLKNQKFQEHDQKIKQKLEEKKAYLEEFRQKREEMRSQREQEILDQENLRYEKYTQYINSQRERVKEFQQKRAQTTREKSQKQMLTQKSQNYPEYNEKFQNSINDYVEKKRKLLEKPKIVKKDFVRKQLTEEQKQKIQEIHEKREQEKQDKLQANKQKELSIKEKQLIEYQKYKQQKQQQHQRELKKKEEQEKAFQEKIKNL